MAPGDWRIASTSGSLGQCHAQLGDRETAESLLQASYEQLESGGAPPMRLRAIGEHLVELYTDWGKPEQARSWSERLAR